MITQEEFLKRLRLASPFTGNRVIFTDNPEDFSKIPFVSEDQYAVPTIDSVLSYIKTDPFTVKLEQDEFEIYDNPRRPRGLPGIVELYDLSEVKRVIDNPLVNLNNFFFDRGTNTFILNMRRGSHESFAALLYCHYNSGEHDFVNPENQAELYLNQGRGFFLSSASKWILIGRGVKMTAQEKRQFGSELRVAEL